MGKINSTSLKLALDMLLKIPETRRPVKCRFFRSQMQSIIIRALNDLEIKPIPSRRCLSLMNLLEERLHSVYKNHPGYDQKAVTINSSEMSPLKSLPESLWRSVEIYTATSFRFKKRSSRCR